MTFRYEAEDRERAFGSLVTINRHLLHKGLKSRDIYLQRFVHRAIVGVYELDLQRLKSARELFHQEATVFSVEVEDHVGVISIGRAW